MNRVYTKIVGTSFGECQKWISRLTIKNKIWLHPEEINPIDPNAVMVMGEFYDNQTYDTTEEKLGYLPKELAADFEPCIKSGMVYRTKISSITGGEFDNFGVNIFIEVVPKELDKVTLQ